MLIKQCSVLSEFECGSFMRNSLYYAVSIRQNGIPLGYNLLVVLDCLLKMYREQSVDVIQIGKKNENHNNEKYS